MGNLVSFLLRRGSALSCQSGQSGLARATPYGNPVPREVHKLIKQKDLGPGRLIVVGDIHGCYDELLQLLAKLGHQPGHDNLVFVGDLVNKGPKSSEVLQAVRSWCSNSCCWVVRGNHDDAALEARRQLKQGQGPVKPELQWVEHMSPEDEQFLAQLPFSLELQGYNVLVVHAGLLPGVPLPQQQLQHMNKMRDIQQRPDGGYTGLEKAAQGSQPWATAWTGPQHVFFGHDAKRRLQRQPYATGLDTGCVYGGQLTACVLPPISQLQQNQQFSVAVAAPAAQVHSNKSTRDDVADSSSACTEGAERGPGRMVGLTFERLQAQLLSVDAAAVYEEKRK